ncbi:MAG: hypothetical protein ACRELC_06265, partial [Gemmatimonadota bacterium]
FTPLASVWFEMLSGLTPELVSFALPSARWVAPLPALAILFSFQRGILMNGRRTGPITLATAVEVGVVALLFIVFGWGIGLVGVTAAFLAFLGGRLASNLYLLPKVRSALASAGTEA